MNKEAAKDATFILLAVVALAGGIMVLVAGIGWLIYALLGSNGLAALVSIGFLALVWFCIYCDQINKHRGIHS